MEHCSTSLKLLYVMILSNYKQYGHIILHYVFCCVFFIQFCYLKGQKHETNRQRDRQTDGQIWFSFAYEDCTLDLKYVEISKYMSCLILSLRLITNNITFVTNVKLIYTVYILKFD